MDLETVADELYGLRPEEFTAARDQRAAAARKAGDQPLAEQIKALRRPSLAAWAGNLLVRGQPEEVQPLIRLGEGLRRAHRDMDGQQLRELSRQQHALINALSRQARQLAADAGHAIGEGAQREVEQTLHAVLADERAAKAWAEGRLTRPLDATTGFDAALQDVGTREERPAEPPPKKRREKEEPPKPDTAAEERRRQKLDRARQDAEDADRVLRERREEAAAADGRAEETAGLVREAEQRLEELADERESVAERHRKARSAERAARDAARAADRAAREAQSRAEKASTLLRRLAADDRDHRDHRDHRDGEGDDD